ncbi:MAG: hypothetical protein IIB38_06850 [Candidatus Hydrogenedentes bacterium]|nr:hypothetical protein [Candidatus Hydrogenedentota bacterium]
MKNGVCLALLLLSLFDPAGRGEAVADTGVGTGGSIVGTLSSVWLRKYPMIVYLDGVEGNFRLREETPVLDQKNKAFVPHVIALMRGTTVHYVNHDDVKHNVYFVAPDETNLNLGTGTEDWSRDHTMDQAGVYAHRCNVHDEMSAYIISFTNPFFTLIDKGPTRKTAGFRLDGVPAGTYQLRVWCEKYYDQEGHPFNTPWEVTVQDGQETVLEVKPKTK